MRLGLYGRKVQRAHSIWREVEKAVRILVFLKLAGEAMSASPWSMLLFKATTVRLTISDRG
jgi:deoxyhypusine synthase